MTALSSDPESDVSGATPSQTLPPGTMVGPFQIVGVLGRGGMATVYEAYDERLERSIALKVLPPEFLHGGTFSRRFEKEARVVAKLEHPNIVPIYASGINDGIPWMSMRLLAGGNMGTLLKHRRPDSRQAVHLLRHIADALDYAHARGVVHRDIKPTNILLDGADGVYVGDFGLAQMLDGAPGLTRTGTLTGTPQYMAPEQVLGNPVDHRGDIYSLGIVAYEIFVGAIPFTAESPVAVLLKHVNEPLPMPPDRQIAPALMRAVQKATAKRPGDRWPSAGAFAAALETAVGVPHASPGAYDVRGTSRDRGRSRAAWAGAAGGALLVAAGLAWLVPRESVPDSATAPLSTLERPSDAGQRAADLAAVSQEVNVPPVVATTTPVRPTPRVIQVVPPSPRQATVVPIEPAPPPPPSPPDVEAPQSRAAQPSTPPADVPASADSKTSEAGVASPATGVASPATPLLADVITPPTRTRTVSPDYPIVARAAELEGEVLLQAVVESDGSVSNVEVLQSVHPVLDEAARKAVLQYVYTPGRRNGIPEPAKVRITVSFRLR